MGNMSAHTKKKIFLRRCYMNGIPGYTYGDPNLPEFPLSAEDFSFLKKTLLFSKEDEEALRKAHEVLKDQVEEILDVWYDFVGSNDHLVYYFKDKTTGEPLGDYLQRVRKRFGQWILDTTGKPYDHTWGRYQVEIGLRHHRKKKNQTDNAQAPEHIPFRYLWALLVPIFLTIKPFLAKKGHSPEEVDKMHTAWLKSVVLQLVLWSYPYVTPEDF